MSSMRFTALSVCILVFVGLASADGNKRCMRLCPRILFPVCGQNSEGDHRTFPNECELNNYNCVHPEAEYELLHNGTCTQQKRSEVCSVICPWLYQPVCGENLQRDHLTFVNDCERVKYNCAHPESYYASISEETCEQYTQSDCPRWCTGEYHPHCGWNADGEHKTFSNLCELRKYNCFNPESKYSLQHFGAC